MAPWGRDLEGSQREVTKCVDYAFVIDMKSGGGELWGGGWDRRPAVGSVRQQRRGFRRGWGGARGGLGEGHDGRRRALGGVGISGCMTGI